MAAAAIATEETLWDKVTKFLGGNVGSVITELHMLMPDSILFGSLLLFLLTQNQAFGIFGVFIFETVLSHKLISWTSAQTVGASRPKTIDIKCRSGFKTPQFAVERMFLHDSYPSYSTFSISAIATYLTLATTEFSSTMKTMGPDWSLRVIMSYIFIGLLLCAFLGFRCWSYCDSLSEILMAFTFAVITGAIFFYINKKLFGIEAMNFLGLPYMVSKESEGSSIYVCAASTST